MVLTTGESIKVAENFIERNLITDEDLKQEIYVKSLELAGTPLTKNKIREELKEVVNKYDKKDEEDACTFISDLLESNEELDHDETLLEINKEYTKLINDLQRKMVGDIITRLLNTLPEVERRVIIETYYNEMTKDELAVILDMSADSVTKYHEEALKKMRAFKNEQAALRAFLVDMI